MYYMETTETSLIKGDQVITTAGIYIRSDEPIQLPDMVIGGHSVLRGKGIATLPEKLRITGSLDFDGTSIPYVKVEDSVGKVYCSVILGDQNQLDRTARVRICTDGFFGTLFEFLGWAEERMPDDLEEMRDIAMSLVSRAVAGHWHEGE